MVGNGVVASLIFVSSSCTRARRRGYFCFEAEKKGRN